MCFGVSHASFLRYFYLYPSTFYLTPYLCAPFPTDLTAMAGVINSLRSRAWLVIGFIAFSLLLFIISSVLSNDFNTLLSGDRTLVGEIAGEKIPYDRFSGAYNTALQTNANQLDEAGKQQLVTQVWEQQINEVLLGREMERLGLTVTREESQRLLVGNDPSPVILQIPQFRNADGSFNPDAVREINAQARTNPQLAAQLAGLQQQVNDSRKQEKYLALLQQASFVSTAEARKALQDQRSTVTFDYLSVNFAAVQDSQVKLDDADFRAFYKKHKERFRQAEPQAVLRYVSFPKVPTAADSAALNAEVQRLLGEFATTTEDSLFASQNSDVTIPTDYRNLLTLDDTLRSQVRGTREGTVIGPIREGNAIRIVKVLDSRTDTLPDAKLRVLLVSNPQLADSLARVATPANFSQLAIQYSEDQQSRFSGGDIGVYRYGALGDAADAAIRNAGVGVISKPITLQNGANLVVQVTERSDREIRLAIIQKEIVPSPATINALEAQARNFAAAAKEQGLDSAARKAGFDVRSTLPLTPASTSIPGLDQGRGIIQWAFVTENSKVGDVTESRDVGNALIVANLLSRNMDDYRTLDDVRDEIRPEVLNAKKAAYVIEKLGDTKGQQLQALTGKVTGAFVSKAENVNASAPGVPGIGPEPKVLGAVFGLPLNTTSAPIEGRSGVYVLNVTSRTAADSTITDADVASLQERLSAQRKQTLVNRLYQGLREAAKIKDYRYRWDF